MRLSFALPTVASGLLLGWAVCAQTAAPPPATPIFYCPGPPAAKAAPAAARAPAQAPAAHVARLAYHHRVGCPSERRAIAMEHHRWAPARHEVRVAAMIPPPAPRPPGDVSASQAFIYRYELAVHGLNARAADQAWGHGPPPRGAYAEQAPPPGAMAPPPPMMRRGWGAHPLPPVPPPPPAYAEAAPMPPAVHIYVHPAPPAPPPPVQHYGYQSERPVQHYGYLPGPALRGTPPSPPAWRERAGVAYAYEQRQSESSHGWSWSNDGGQVHYERWGDHGRWPDHDRGPCPPSPRGCSADGASEGSGWRDGSYGHVYNATGRDASGYLVWPGKTPGE